MYKKVTMLFLCVAIGVALVVSCRQQQVDEEPDRQAIMATVAQLETDVPEIMEMATPDILPAGTPEPSAPSMPVDTITTTTDILRGVGLIGASTLDEYRGTENRGGQYAAVTFNMAEQLALLRDFNLGEWGSWGEPRRTGYEYNWARSGATSSSMIRQGQHTGVAEQVARGEVTFVFILIGANDFGPHVGHNYVNIYDGRMSDEQLQRKIDEAIANVTLAVDTVLEAGALGVGVSLFPHWYFDPRTLENFPDAARRQRVEDAIAEINMGIQAMATERGIMVVDPNAFGLQLLMELDENGFLDVGGELIDFINPGNEPRHARLNDQSGHAGTVLSGLMANYYFIEPLNVTYNTNIAPLTHEEILSLAGIGPEQR